MEDVCESGYSEWGETSSGGETNENGAGEGRGSLYSVDCKFGDDLGRTCLPFSFHPIIK